MEVEYVYSLKELRNHFQISQKMMAEGMGKNQSDISKLETNYPNIDLRNLLEYFDCLGGKLQYVLNFGDKIIILDFKERKK